MNGTSLPDGIDALMAELRLGDVMHLIEQTARWVDPETFKLLPVWYPEHARRAPLYNNNWTEPRMNTNKSTGTSVPKMEGNTNANKSLTMALGLTAKGRKSWTCCHIWGVDDASYQKANVVVQDHRFFSCVANMVLLPTPLKAFTDTMPDVKAMLRICTRNLYGWKCDHESMRNINAELDGWSCRGDYPKSWPQKKGDALPPGVIPINDRIRKSASRRLKNINKDISSAGSYYPREQVKKALAYWNIDCRNF